eukprot:TRINITY_DN726_c0_g1_i1.p1 TRINITY_DN726_c0_g1~~TRINITY_DN726_c0_g1_i1.p1  ORF type:complete len:177 (+),score=37.04 TRINITY_DN726_c0_g1_i1:230-760(+)
MDFEYVPWGNAYFVTSECGGQKGQYDVNVRECWDSKCGQNPVSDCFTGDMVCQHGDNECFGNIAESCAKNQSTSGAKQYMPFVYCWEGQNGASKNTLNGCASMFGLSGPAITACTESPGAKNLTILAAQTTAEIPGGHPGVPYITVNGKYLSNTNELLRTVCKDWTGPKPKGCPIV